MKSKNPKNFSTLVKGYDKGLERCRDDVTKQKIEDGKAQLAKIEENREKAQEDIEIANADAARAKAKLYEISDQRAQMNQTIDGYKKQAYRLAQQLADYERRQKDGNYTFGRHVPELNRLIQVRV